MTWAHPADLPRLPRLLATLSAGLLFSSSFLAAQGVTTRPAGEEEQRFFDVVEKETVRVRETSLGKIGDGFFPKSAVVSADGLHVAWAHLSEEESGVFIDGKRVGKPFQLLGASGLVLSPDGSRVAYTIGSGTEVTVRLDEREFSDGYVGVSRSGLTFSPDSKRFGFVAARDEAQIVVLDGKPGPSMDGVSSNGLVFSPDSKRAAYAAVKGDQWFVFLDGERNGPWGAIGKDGVVFSPDSARMAFAARRDLQWYVVLDGEEFGPYASADHLTFSPDGKRFAYEAELEKKSFVMMLDGEPSAVYGHLSSRPIFSDDSGQFAFAGRREDRLYVVLNGVEGPGYAPVGNKVNLRIAFTPDGEHHAYFGKGEKAFVLVLDGEEGATHTRVFQRTLRLTSDGQAVYIISGPNTSRVVFRGKESDPYPALIQKMDIFSEDGQHLAFGVRDGREQFIVLDGIEGDRYAYLFPELLTFTADGQNLVYVGRRGKEIRPVIHGFGKGPAYDEIPKGSRMTSSPEGNPRFIAMRDDEFFLVEVDVAAGR